MARRIWDPVRDLMTLQERMNHLFEEAADRRGAQSGAEAEIERADWIPAADVYEDAQAFTLILDLPGIERERLDVSIDDGRLTIRGERSVIEDGGDARRAERPAGRFVRSFSLPEAVDRHDITADYRDGLLKLRLPKRTEEQARRVKIEIK